MKNSKLKIIFLSDDFPPESAGGAGMIAHEDATGLVARGHEVVVIAATSKEEEAGEKSEKGLRVIRLFSRSNPRFRFYTSLNNRSLVKKIEAILKKEQPDVIHAHNIHTHISYKILAAARKCTEKVFLTAHDAMPVHYGKFAVPADGDLRVSELKNFREQRLRYNPFRRGAIRHYLKNVKTVFAVSEALKKLLEANGIKRVQVLHNGIDAAAWKDIDPARRNGFISRYGLEGKKVILFAGRISGLKGGLAVMDAFHKVLMALPDACLLCVGKSSTGENDMKSSEGILFTGQIPREDMKYIYSLAHVVAVPSLYLDPFPTVNLEAMASSKPVVGTCFGGTPEAVIDGVTGYIVNPHDTEAFAKALIEALSDPAKARDLGINGYERLIKHFNKDAHISALLSCYNSTT